MEMLQYTHLWNYLNADVTLLNVTIKHDENGNILLMVIDRSFTKRWENLQQKLMYLTFIYLTKKNPSPNKNYKQNILCAEVQCQEAKIFY